MGDSISDDLGSPDGLGIFTYSSSSSVDSAQGLTLVSGFLDRSEAMTQGLEMSDVRLGSLSVL